MRKLMLAGVTLILLVSTLWLYGKSMGEEPLPPGLFPVLGGPPRALGTFKLNDHTGAPFTPERLQGRWSLVFFGYTHCPDICPVELGQMAAIFEKMQKQDPAWGKKVQGVFISVDPQRDTLEHLAGYLKHFHPDLVGATGTVEEITALARAFGSQFMRLKEESTGEEAFMHSSSFYLVDPKGRLVTILPSPHEPEELAGKLLSLPL